MGRGLTRLLYFLALALVLSVPPAQAQTAPPQRPAPAWDVAPVIVDGVELFELRGTSAFPATERAQRVARRIVAIAEDPAIDPGGLQISPDPLGLRLHVGGRAVVTLVAEDGEIEDVQIEPLADAIKGRIIESIRTYRAERSKAVLLARALHAGIALVLMAAALAALIFVTRWLLAYLERHKEHLIQDVRVQSFRLLRSEQIHSLLRNTLKLLRAVIVVVLVCSGLLYVLGLFPWTRLAASRVVDILLDPLRVTLDAVLANVPNIIFIAIIVVLARVTIRLTYLLFRATERRVVRFSGFEPEWAMPTYKIARLAIIAFALVVAYPYIPGSDSAAFKGISIFAGVILSLGSSSVISNVIAGYTMVYRRAFAVGDWIRVGDCAGEVVEMRLLVTHLRSWKNEALVLPNSQILSTEVINYSALAQDQGLILHPTVGIGYEVPWRQVEAMLIEAAARTEGLRREPPPFVLEKALGDFAITYELNVPCGSPSAMPLLYARLHRNILDVFNEHGVQIMTPNYRADPETPKLVPREHWYDPPAEPAPAAD